MKGTIRLVAGLVVVFGGVGGMDMGPNPIASFGIALTGLALMAWAVVDMNKEQDRA